MEGEEGGGKGVEGEGEEERREWKVRGERC